MMINKINFTSFTIISSVISLKRSTIVFRPTSYLIIKRFGGEDKIGKIAAQAGKAIRNESNILGSQAGKVIEEDVLGSQASKVSGSSPSSSHSTLQSSPVSSSSNTPQISPNSSPESSPKQPKLIESPKLSTNPIESKDYSHVKPGYHGFFQVSKLFNNTSSQTTNESTSPTSTPPTPPPLPPKPIKVESTQSFTEELKTITNAIQNKSNNNNPLHSLNPSDVTKCKKVKPFTQQEKKQEEEMKQAAKMQYLQNTKIHNPNLTNEELIMEMEKRSFVKDADNTAVVVKNNKSANIVVGKNINNIKPTSLGQAYLNLTEKTEYFPNKPDLNNIEYKIGILPTGNNVFLSSSKQKHLVVVYNKENDTYHAIGYLTSKKNTILLNDKQFKQYQDEKISKVTYDNKEQKPQYFKKFDNAESVEKDQIVFVKEGTEYLNNVLEFKQLENTRLELSKESFSDYNNQNYTKQQVIDACLAYDLNIKENKPHPKTNDQIKMEEMNKIKVKQISDEYKAKNKSNKENKGIKENDDNKML